MLCIDFNKAMRGNTKKNNYSRKKNDFKETLNTVKKNEDVLSIDFMDEMWQGDSMLEAKLFENNIKDIWPP